MQKTLRTLVSARVQGLWQHECGVSGNIDVGLVVAWLMDSLFQSLALKIFAQSLLPSISLQVYLASIHGGFRMLR